MGIKEQQAERNEYRLTAAEAQQWTSKGAEIANKIMSDPRSLSEQEVRDYETAQAKVFNNFSQMIIEECNGPISPDELWFAVWVGKLWSHYLGDRKILIDAGKLPTDHVPSYDHDRFNQAADICAERHPNFTSWGVEHTKGGPIKGNKARVIERVNWRK